jgi:hypothetical protein
MPSSQLFNLKNMLKIFNIFFKLKSCENGIWLCLFCSVLTSIFIL